MQVKQDLSQTKFIIFDTINTHYKDNNNTFLSKPINLDSTLISVIKLTVIKKCSLINNELIMTHSAWHLCYTAEGHYLYAELDSCCGCNTGALQG